MTNDTLFRFVLSNPTLGNLPILEPIGWDDAKLKLERDYEFHSIIEFYDQPVTFFKEGDSGDGGYDYIKSAIDTLGADGEVEFLVYISEDSGSTYETLFSGLVDLSTYTNIDSYKIQCGIIRNDLWSTFQNRRGNAFNLLSPTDVEGNARVVLSPQNVDLPSQKIRMHTDVNLGVAAAFFEDDFTASNFIQIGFDVTTLDEVSERYNIYPAITDNIPVNIFSVEYSGLYTFDIRIEASRIHYTISPGYPTCTKRQIVDDLDVNVTFYFKVNDTTSPIAFTETSVGGGGYPGANGGTVYTYSGSHTLTKGDEITIYGDVILSMASLEYASIFIYGTDNIINIDDPQVIIDPGPMTCSFFDGTAAFTGSPPSGLDTPTYMRVTADTVFEDSVCQAFPLHEAFQCILDRILLANDTFYSEYLGNGGTQRRTYGSDGCGSSYVVTKGLHIRGYDMSDKIFSASFDDLWDGSNPIFNLALQTTEVSGQEVIEILDKDSIYESGEAIYLDYVNEIERTIDTSRDFKKIEIGYQKWESEDFSGIDDPQTKHEYVTPLKRIGEEITLYSRFIAASLAIENTRRKTVVQGKDYKLDNDIFIIAMGTSALYATPPVYTPDLTADFLSISGVLNSSTRYNLKLTPTRNFLRWYQYFNGTFYDLYSGSNYVFSNGEGNYTMQSNLSAGCNADGNYNEDSDIPMNLEDGYHSNMMLSFDYPLSYSEYKTIKANRNKRIMVSDTASNHEACRIDSIEYQITKGLATFKLWKV